MSWSTRSRLPLPRPVLGHSVCACCVHAAIAATLDAGYAPHQQCMGGVMRRRGYVEGDNWTTRVFEGAEHNEAAWKARVAIPLGFLLAD